MKDKLKKSLSAIWVPLLAVFFSFIVGAILIMMAGKSPILAYKALFKGSFGTLPLFFQMLNKATPLLFTGLAVAVAYRAKVINIGGEGQLVMGALGATLAGIYLDLPAIIHIPITIAAAFIFGSLWVVIPAFLKIKKDVNPVISTIMMNYVAALFVQFLVVGPLKHPGELLATDWLKKSAWLPFIIGAPFRLGAGILLGIVCAVALSFLLNKTVSGYEIKAVGFNQRASKVAGINVEKNMLIALMISGGLAGLAGGIEVTSFFHRLYDGFSPGYGFDGISVALLARSNPYGVILTSLLFAILRSGAVSMQTSVGVSRNVVDAMQGVIILFIAGEAMITLLIAKFKKKGGNV